MTTRRNFLKASAATAAGAITATNPAQMASAATLPRTFVLVHGAWHGGWCWRDTKDILTKHGNRVFAPSLTGVGDRAHLLSKDISLQTHIQDVINLVESEELKDFVLVGHSYGGIVISGVADALRERVSHYVYLDAVIPADMSPGSSFSWSAFNTPEARETRLKSVREQGNASVLPAPPPGAFGVTDPAQVAWIQRRLQPMPVQTYTGTYTFKNSGSNGMKRTYIAANKPQYAPLVSTYERIKADKTWSFTTIEAGHDAMVIAPDALASLLMEI